MYRVHKYFSHRTTVALLHHEHQQGIFDDRHTIALYRRAQDSLVYLKLNGLMSADYVEIVVILISWHLIEAQTVVQIRSHRNSSLDRHLVS